MIGAATRLRKPERLCREATPRAMSSPSRHMADRRVARTGAAGGDEALELLQRVHGALGPDDARRVEVDRVGRARDVEGGVELWTARVLVRRVDDGQGGIALEHPETRDDLVAHGAPGRREPDERRPTGRNLRVVDLRAQLGPLPLLLERAARPEPQMQHADLAVE